MAQRKSEDDTQMQCAENVENPTDVRADETTVDNTASSSAERLEDTNFPEQSKSAERTEKSTQELTEINDGTQRWYLFYCTQQVTLVNNPTAWYTSNILGDLVSIPDSILLHTNLFSLLSQVVYQVPKVFLWTKVIQLGTLKDFYSILYHAYKFSGKSKPSGQTGNLYCLI